MGEVFYRKWRPRRLDQVVGQEPVTQTLRQAISLERIAHAYLFCGPRGTGKTSTARILAKAVNCLSPQSGEPDNACRICCAMNEGRALDLIEIDAASNRGIDDIRNLSDKAHFTPNEARYKVYIVDEVHMLTEHAFNALLKTLEEPPAHIIFVLATTEPHKLPATVISRCQRFDFRRIPLDRIVEALAAICQQENIQAGPEALKLIARTSAGSLRDAENLLEQAAVSYGSPLSEEHVRDLLELGGDDVALGLVACIVKRAVRDGLTTINQVAAQGNDLRQLHRGVVEFLRALLLIKSKAGGSFGYSADTMARLNTLADAAPLEQLVQALKTFARVDLRQDSASPLPLELALVEASAERPIEAAGAQAPLGRKARGPAAPGFTTGAEPRTLPSVLPSRELATPGTAAGADTKTLPSASPGRAPAATPAIRPEPQPPARVSQPLAVPAGAPVTPDSQWESIIRMLEHTGRRSNLRALLRIAALLRSCKEREIADDTIILKFPSQSNVERLQKELEDPETRRAVQAAVASVMEHPYDIKVSMDPAQNRASHQRAARESKLVQAAKALGARVVDEKEEKPQ